MLSFWRRQSSNSEPPPPLSSHERGNFTDLAMRYEGEPASRVTYASRSEDAQFVCNLPANSRHLADAQKLSLEIFTGRDEPRRVVEEPQQESRRSLLIKDSQESSKLSRTSPEASSHKRSASIRQSKDSRRQYPDEDISRRFSSTFSSKRSNSHLSGEFALFEAAQAVQERSAPTFLPNKSSARLERRSTSGQKHTSDTHETYLLRGGEGRTLLASAPTGSRVARYHDQVAAQAGTESRTIRDGRLGGRQVLIEERAP